MNVNGGASVRSKRRSSGDDASEVRSRPDIRDLKMSHVEAGASNEESRDSPVLLTVSVELDTVLLQVDGAINSEGLHSRWSRSQLPGFAGKKISSSLRNPSINISQRAKC